jgi:hypothetical protein
MNFFLLLIYLFSGAVLRGDTPKPYAKELKVLFIGNSLTYSNELPAVVTQLGVKEGVKINYQSFCFPDYSLEDHWKEGKVKEEIEKGIYDFVIAQQGPSAMPESRVLLTEYATKFSELCKKNKSRLVMYMVWPSKGRVFDLDKVIQSYSLAAKESGSLLAPAGLAWKNLWQVDSLFSLYSPDGFHPSAEGSLLAALCIYGVISAQKELNSIPVPGNISPPTFHILTSAAGKALSAVPTEPD